MKSGEEPTRANQQLGFESGQNSLVWFGRAMLFLHPCPNGRFRVEAAGSCSPDVSPVLPFSLSSCLPLVPGSQALVGLGCEGAGLRHGVRLVSLPSHSFVACST